VLVAPSFAGAGPSGPVVTQQISTRVGGSVAGGASLVYRYPRGRLQRDFEPPAWGEASARPCQARLFLLAPTVLPQAEPLEGATDTGSLRIPYERTGRARRTVSLKWTTAPGQSAGQPLVYVNAETPAPRELRSNGAVISLGMYATAARARTDDEPCADAGQTKAALTRARTSALSVLRRLTLTYS
jgi:hypothetical protein